MENIVSPKTNSLAYDELKLDSSSAFEVEMVPELNLIIPRRLHHAVDASNSDQPILITGCLSVSF